MAQQIKKKFIGDDQIDGSKIKLLSGEALKGTNAIGEAIELIKEVDGKAIVLGVEVGTKAQIDQSLLDAKSYADSVVLTEKSRAESFESSLSSAINTEKGRIDAILLAADADKDTFAEIVSLINSVDSENDSAFAGYVISNNAAVAAVASDAQDLEAYAQDIRSDFDLEVTDRVAGDAATLVSAKAYTDTVVAGTVQKSYVDAQDAIVLADAKAYTDTAVSGAVQKSYVDSQDDALSARITTLEGKPAVTFKQAKITLTDNLSYVDLPLLAIEDSLHAFVGRLAIHKDDDFSVSVASGVTRLTFIGSLSSPTGTEKVEAGDVIRVVYAVLA